MNRELEVVYNDIIESVKSLGLSPEVTDELIGIISIKVEVFISRHPDFEELDVNTRNETLQKFKTVLLTAIDEYAKTNTNNYEINNKEKKKRPKGLLFYFYLFSFISFDFFLFRYFYF